MSGRVPQDGATQSSEDHASRAHPRVLFADGDEAMRALVRDALEAVGYEVFLAGDARQALELAFGAPDLILVETALPDAGPELIESLHRAAPRVPIVVLVCLGDDQVGRRARQSGATATLPMPVHLAELEHAISDCLEGVA